MIPSQKDVYTVREVAQLIRCDPRIIRREIAEGRLKSLPMKRPLRVTRESLDDWMKNK